LEPDQLIRQAADLIRERFNLYHVGLFMVDETGRWADYRAGTGEAGRLLQERGLRLEVGGNSMTGWCITHAQARVAQDVRLETVRVDHPLLAAACSEIALPLIARGRVIGALNAQSERLGAFEPDTVAVLQTMADQVAVALDNARLFAASQTALEAERRAYGELSRQAWSELLGARPTPGYRYVNRTVAPLETYAQSSPSPTTLQVPIQVRDQILGRIDLHKSADSPAWTPDEIELAKTLAEQLNMALDSARLYQDTQRRAATEQLLGQVTARMRESLDIDAMLKTAAQEIRSTLGLSEVIVSLTAPADHKSDNSKNRL
jgi:GAF domain-containing protein